MKAKTKSETNFFSQVQSRIIALRNQRVILDSNVAELYGVETREINQAVKNNPDKFPKGYVFELEKSEKEEVIKNFDKLPSKYSPSIPKAFTEKGLYMLATILKSLRATHNHRHRGDVCENTRIIAYRQRIAGSIFQGKTKKNSCKKAARFLRTFLTTAYR
jgi:hypothetical protein